MMKQFLKQLKHFCIYLLVIAGTLLFIQLFARTSFTDGYLSFDLQPQLASEGGISINIPPFGKLFYRSHQTPWQLVFTIREIKMNQFDPSWLKASWITSISPKQGWTSIYQKKELLKSIYTLIGFIVGFGLLGGLTVLLLLRVPLTSGLFRNSLVISLMAVLLLLGSTALSFDSQFLEKVHYQGFMASAPWMINMFSNGMEVVKAIGNHLKNLSNEFPLLFKQVDQIKSLENVPVDLRILHVSDIHNNSAAFDLISELALNFKIDLVIDTGDITDYGTPFELAIAQKISDLKIPYIFIPGNHDSPIVIERLKRLRRVKVLSNGVIEINGLTIAGFADPTSFNFSSNMVSEEELVRAGRQLAQYVLQQETVPDLVAVHNLKQAGEVIGKVPVILHGHTHKYSLTVNDGSVIDNAGTTGAAGIRGLKPEGVPYSASILYWGKNDQGILKLRTVDSIKINGIKGFFTIDRRTFD